MKRLARVLLPAMLLFVFAAVKAQYVIREADARYELFDYMKAIQLYEQAYQKKQTLHAAERLAVCYTLVQNYKEAESWYAVVVNMAGSTPESRLHYAQALQNNQKYNEAKAMYAQYAALNPAVSAAQKNIWFLSCDSAAIWMKAPRPILIENLRRLNTDKSDWGAVAYGTGLVFASDRNISPATLNTAQKSSSPFLKFDSGKGPGKEVYGWTGNSYLHLFVGDAVAGDIQVFPATLNTDYHTGPASFTADGNEMYFTLTRYPKRPELDKTGKVTTINTEIFIIEKDQDHWTLPKAFKYNDITAYSAGDPYISKDGQTLYFSSNMPGGKGGTDIYYCRRNAGDDWSPPVGLTAVNTPGNERTPNFGADGNFYFSSDGLIGMGGLDIFKSAVTNGVWATPVNMGYPVNSPRDDFSYSYDTTLSGYFSSDRSGGTGSDDLYSFSWLKPIVIKLEGVIYDKITNQPLSNALITLSKSGGMSLKFQTGADGSFKFDMEPNSTYDLTGEKTNFRSDAADLTTVNLKTSTTLVKDLYLEKIELNKEIVLKNIYYDFNKFNIRPDAAKELDKLVNILRANPTMWIELGSHTDSRGNDAYNLSLSQKRASSAVQYMINQGIGKNRISAKGYGESQLLNRCYNGAQCTEEEHQANRRTEFKIIKQ